MEIIQRTTWSKTSIAVTISVILLMIGVSIFIYFTDGHLILPSISVLVVLAVICLCAMLFMPEEVRLDSKALTVMFAYRCKAFAISDIEDVEPFTDVKKIWRVCGSGAFFGWWGWFAAKGTGKFMMYASNLDPLLLIRLTNSKKYVISCSDPEEIINKIRQTTKR